MKESPQLLSVGLTGGIGCGKTTVGRMLEGRGCRLIDADQIGRDLVRPDQAAFEEIVERFGREILGPEGGIDRRALALRVFSDPDERKALEQILHPRILAEEERILILHAEAPEPGITIIEAGLMVEAGSYRRYDRLVVVRATPELQVLRLEGRGYSADEARARMKAQMPVEEKADLADYVVDNTADTETLRAKVETLRGYLQEDLEAKKAGNPLPERDLVL